MLSPACSSIFAQSRATCTSPIIALMTRACGRADRGSAAQGCIDENLTIFCGYSCEPLHAAAMSDLSSPKHNCAVSARRGGRLVGGACADALILQGNGACARWTAGASVSPRAGLAGGGLVSSHANGVRSGIICCARLAHRKHCAWGSDTLRTLPALSSREATFSWHDSCAGAAVPQPAKQTAVPVLTPRGAGNLEMFVYACI